LILHSIFTIC